MKKIMIVVPEKNSHPDTYIEQLKEVTEVQMETLQEIQTKDYLGVVLLDAEHQLPVKEVQKLIDALREEPDKVHIGSRVGFPQRTFTQKLFRFFYGVTINDIQSPFQAIPAAYIPRLLKETKQTAHWHTQVLTKLAIQKVPIKEVMVEVEDEKPKLNTSFSFYLVFFSVFLKYILSSFSSFLVDILFFQLFLFLARDLDDSTRIVLSTIGARIVSSAYNFLVNNFIVFKNKEQHKKQWVKYYSLVVFEMLMSSFMVAGLYGLLGWNETLLKILVDGGLFFFGYYIEKHYIF